MFRIACTAALALAACAASAETIEIAPVWAGHPVGFSLLTHPPHQFAAFYADDRRLTVASRTLDSKTWIYTVLPETVGWDSHNSITMALDRYGHLHLAGNMHCVPLVYFRAERPFDTVSLTRVESMIGNLEDRATYPKFLRGPDGELIFTYRDGGSGRGNQIYNRYDADARTWRRLLDTPLVDGEGLRNAYFDGPRRGPDGFFHLCWVWRDTPDCATNHHPSYARSRDLVHWQRSDGAPLELPITFNTGEVVDPVLPGGGIINGNLRLGFDLEQRPILTYHKYDAAGLTQLHHARRENGAWKIRQASDWDYRWNFGGGGSIDFEIRLSPVHIEDGALVQQWSHAKYGAQRWRLDPKTLQPTERLPNPPPSLPEELRALRSAFPGMQVRSAGDLGKAEKSGVHYLLRWETLDRNRDKPREKPWPAPTQLELVRIEK